MRFVPALAVTAVLIAGCGKSDLPQGPDFARLEAPMTNYGLDAFRRGDAVGLERARNELLMIARDEQRPGEDKCAREVVIAREADRIATLLGRLGRVGLLNASEEERFVFFENFANSLDYQNPVTCGVQHFEHLGEILPAVMPQSRDALSTYYFVWRENLSAALGADAEARFTMAADRLVSRGLPRSPYR